MAICKIVKRHRGSTTEEHTGRIIKCDNFGYIRKGSIVTIYENARHIEDTYYCGSCGKRMEGDFLNFCDNCGEPVEMEHKTTR